MVSYQPGSIFTYPFSIDRARLIRSLVAKSKKGYRLKVAVLVGTGGGKAIYVSTLSLPGTFSDTFVRIALFLKYLNVPILTSSPSIIMTRTGDMKTLTDQFHWQNQTTSD